MIIIAQSNMAENRLHVSLSVLQQELTQTKKCTTTVRKNTTTAQREERQTCVLLESLWTRGEESREG